MPSSPPENTTDAPLQKRSRLIRFCAFAAAFFILLALGVFLFRDQIASGLKATITSKLESEGVFFTAAHSSFSPLRGLVFENVTIYFDPIKETPLLSLSDLAIAVNPLRKTDDGRLSALITASNASFTAHRSTEAFKLTEVDLLMRVSGGRIHINHFKAVANGLALDLSAEIALAGSEDTGDGQDPSTEGNPGGALDGLDLSFLAKTLSILSTKPKGTHPKLQAHIDIPAEGPLTASGSLKGKHFTWRETAFDSLSLRIELASEEDSRTREQVIRQIQIPSLEFVYEGARLHASGSYHIDSDTVILGSCTSKTDPLSLYASLFPDSAKAFDGFRVLQAPKIDIKGTIPLSHPDASALTGDIADGSVSIVTSGTRELVISSINTSLQLLSGTLTLPDFTASVFGESAAAEIQLQPFRTPLPFSGKVSLEQAPVSEIASHFELASGGAGRVDATFEGGGTPALASLDGHGRVRLTGANSVSLPIVKSLFATLKTVIPQLKQSEGTSVTADYSIKNAVVATDNAKLKSGALGVDGTVRLDLNDNYAHATAKAYITGAGSILTSLAGKALEMEGEGPLGQIKWQFKNLPSLGAGDAAGTVIKGAKGVGNTAGEIIKGIGAAAKKTGATVAPKDDSEPSVRKGLKKLIPGTDN